jgi:hypothetical protein
MASTAPELHPKQERRLGRTIHLGTQMQNVKVTVAGAL